MINTIIPHLVRVKFGTEEAGSVSSERPARPDTLPGNRGSRRNPLVKYLIRVLHGCFGFIGDM